jgi:flagellar hook-associated protein 2
MPITATGIGSGLDVESLVTQLVQSDVVPASQRLALKEARFQSEISAYGALKGALASFQSAASAASSASQYTSFKATTSDSNKVSVSVAEGAAEGSYSVGVTSLAEAHSLASPQSVVYSSADAVVGLGNLTIKVGTLSYDGGGSVTGFSEKTGSSTTSITIDSTNNTLAGVRDAINQSGAPVEAAVVYDGSQYRLTIQATSTGLENSISIDVTDTGDSVNDDNAGLSVLSFNAGASNLSETNRAVNAAFTINGLDVTSASNTVSDALDGVSLTLKGVTTDPVTSATNPASISVTQDLGRAKSAVQSFVDAYNEFIATLNDLTAYDSEQQAGSVFTGDGTVRSIASRLRNEINSSIDAEGASYKTLAELGVTTTVSDGKLQLDSTKLSEVLENNPADVAVVLANIGTSTNTNIEFVSSTSSTAVGQYSVSLEVAETAARYNSSASTVSPTNNKTISFDLTIDGVTNAITASSGTGNPTYATIAGILESAIDTAFGSNVVSVSESAGVFTLETVSQGSSSSISISNLADDAALFGFSAASGTSGTSVISGKINGVDATYDEENKTLTGAAGTPVEGLVLRIKGGASGSLGTLTYTEGIGTSASELLESLLASDGLIEARIDGLNESVKDIASQTEALELRATALERRYRAQFNGLETLIAQLNTTQSYLSQALSGFVEPNTTLRK